MDRLNNALAEKRWLSVLPEFALPVFALVGRYHPLASYVFDVYCVLIIQPHLQFLQFLTRNASVYFILCPVYYGSVPSCLFCSYSVRAFFLMYSSSGLCTYQSNRTGTTRAAHPLSSRVRYFTCTGWNGSAGKSYTSHLLFAIIHHLFTT